ncbi:MAG TPA: MBL fold metallo-hydrolase, partial [Candidatus Hydrogenedentes bacterium]|nr:MBL fold metallo-hydrolase [Candidatus Hydrogenedentota bacterium]
MKITAFGAAEGVTGSKHLVEVNGSRVLLDCGMFQGQRKQSDFKNRHFPFDARSLDSVVLSHAHIDHSGLLPILAKNGFRGRVFATCATRDLC